MQVQLRHGLRNMRNLLPDEYEQWEAELQQREDQLKQKVEKQDTE